MRAARLLGAGAAALAALALALPAAAGAAESARALFERGVELYEAGDPEGAAAAFEDVLAAGVDDPAVHFNLGNAWFKAGRLGRAILHYRRAHELAPRDEDVAANLEYARFLALDRVEGDDARTDRRVDGWLDRVTPEEAVRAPVLLALLAGAAAVLWQLLPHRAALFRRIAAGAGIAWAVSLALAVAVERRAAGREEAVVLAGEVSVRNGPGEAFATAFVLHEGAEVVVEEERGAWTEISLPGELRGWISSATLGRL